MIGRINDYFGISIHSPRMGRDFCPWITLFCIVISIHSPRMGRDLVLLQMLSHFVNFNPLSPHGERRCDYPHSAKRLYFNPLSPHGERHTVAAKVATVNGFQSTLPAWGETWRGLKNGRAENISIHSPRMGRDRLPSFRRAVERIFQSTLPAWGETEGSADDAFLLTFQSTLPAWGETESVLYRSPVGEHFNPLSPHGERRLCGRYDPGRRHFNPLSPHGERQQTHTTFRREKLAHLHNIVSFRQQRGSSC